jgi:hypothetical protein
MNLKKMFATTGITLLCAAALAQDNGPGPGPGGPGGGGPGGGRRNFDPAQMQQRMEERMKEIRTQMDVKDDAEWKIIQDRITKVQEARREAMQGMFGRGGPGGRRGGDNGGPGGPGMGGQNNPELEALNAAVRSNAPKDQIQAALDKYRKVRKEKEAALEKAQAALKELLSVKQEAVAVANGMLN